MIRVFRVFLSDMWRLRSNVVALVIVMGLSIIPALYAWFNILSNWDVYGEDATSQMHVAVYSEDAGFAAGSLALNIGDSVVEGLEANRTIGWVFTGTKEEALEGVESGDFYAALVIPENFTAEMISFLGGDPTNPAIQYYENSKKNAIATKITGKAKTAVQGQINETFISTLTSVVTASGELLAQTDENGADLIEAAVGELEKIDESLRTYADILSTFSLVTASVSDLAGSAQDLLINTEGVFSSSQDTVAGMQTSVLSGAQTADTLSSLINITLDSMDDDLTILYDQADTLEGSAPYAGMETSVAALNQASSSTIRILKDVLGETDRYVKNVAASYERLEEDIAAFKKDAIYTKEALSKLKRNIKKDIRNCKDSIREIRQSFQYKVNPGISQTILDIENALIQTGILIGNVEGSFVDVGDALEEYQRTLDSGTDDIAATKEYVQGIRADIGGFIKELSGLSDDEQFREVIDMLGNDPDLVARFVSSPVSMVTEEVYAIGSYGSAMAPFYTVLALWVGALILVALIHVSVKTDKEERLKNVKPRHAYFGRYITFFLIGQAQTAITVLGDLFYIGIECRHPALFYLAGAVTSFVFTLFIYSLTVAFGNVGEAVAVVVMVIQVAGAGGTFPVEVLPEVYQALYRFLPFTYCMNAMRECVGGMYEMDYWKDLGALGIYVLVSLFIGLVLAVPFRRLNSVIERSKERSKVML